MGVTSLWQILEPVKQHAPLCSLKGKTLAVDLSLWVCEAQAVKKMVGVVTNPHLRNLYCRVSSLTLMGIHLVFVTEGDLPKLKSSTVQKRIEARFGPLRKPEIAKKGRSRFKSILKECLELLETLGIPWIQAAGEAEAMCAYLNANGHVDGCITNDSDVFLYGAQTVYRNFTMDIKDPHVDCYLIADIEEKLGCSRESLIGLAILLGCDYLPKGVPGVGKEKALKLVKTLKGQSLLQRFESWKDHFQLGEVPVSTAKKPLHCSVCHHPGSSKDHEDMGCNICGSVGYCEPQETNYCCPCNWHSSESEQQRSLVEEGIKKKAKACEGFPFPEVIHEYLISKDKPVKLNGCQRPNLLSFQRFAVKKMNWTEQYACEKLCSLLTYYDMNRKKSGHTDPKQLQALRIIKSRIRNGIPCFEIVWQKPDHYSAATEAQPADPFLITIEESTLFEAAYPEVVALYQMEKLKIGKEKKKSKKKSKAKECLAGDSKVEDTLSDLNLQPACENVLSQVSKSDFRPVFELQKSPKKSYESLCFSDPADFSTALGKPSNFFFASQNPENEYKPSNSLISQTELFIKEPMACSANTDLQLSGIDWEGTSFKISPRNVNLPWYSESESGLGNNSLKQCSPPHSKAANILTQHSDSAQHNPNLITGVDYSVSDTGFPKEKNDLSLKDRAAMERLEAFPKAKNVPLLNPAQLREQIKATSNPGGEFASPDSIQEIENMILLEKHLRELNLESYREDLRSYKDPPTATDKVKDSGSSWRPMLKVSHLENKQQILPSKSNKVLGNCQIGGKSVPRIMKSSFKKSVCQNSYHAEDSDSENVEDRWKGHRIPKQQRKSHMVQLKDKCNGKRDNKKLAFEIQPEPKGKVDHALKVLNTDLSTEERLLLPLSKSPSLSKCGFDPCLQETRSDLNMCLESPLPLSERLKHRLKSS
ncbi:flap endonuclease GEN homolog 1 isoform X1 [Ahaetulla prasina]|uniref:flap endonuclease GEN homolog 1 isoform X1 n=2 Tax=Ahaetulla prasina TaxID=499056 RepID=UPI002649B0BB|nr:flap endonuclease GEN homolog 1 isoform X1 [Ahaetulla prasina]XP_058035076.1 flap endonuclease GEN homolog 1 isoform X1 [Ahaetulla prasina]XP_058035086.1 flap endonuclease GEN homolog 1 isoform X1 [Ahaetulla prasina]